MKYIGYLKYIRPLSENIMYKYYFVVYLCLLNYIYAVTGAAPELKVHLLFIYLTYLMRVTKAFE